jgi:aspartate carbamoyltransferase catalytic subunit
MGFLRPVSEVFKGKFSISLRKDRFCLSQYLCHVSFTSGCFEHELLHPLPISRYSDISKLVDKIVNSLVVRDTIESMVPNRSYSRTTHHES